MYPQTLKKIFVLLITVVYVSLYIESSKSIFIENQIIQSTGGESENEVDEKD